MGTQVFGDFEWNEQKAAENQRKHGVSFEEATTVFLDLDYMLAADPRHEGRFAAVGFSQLARLLFVVHCERGARVRIISARRATQRESHDYEKRLKTD